MFLCSGAVFEHVFCAWDRDLKSHILQISNTGGQVSIDWYIIEYYLSLLDVEIIQHTLHLIMVAMTLSHIILVNNTVWIIPWLVVLGYVPSICKH